MKILASIGFGAIIGTVFLPGLGTIFGALIGFVAALSRR